MYDIFSNPNLTMRMGAFQTFAPIYSFRRNLKDVYKIPVASIGIGLNYPIDAIIDAFSMAWGLQGRSVSEKLKCSHEDT